MGIKGLLPYLEKACRTGSVQEFEGKRVAVDVSCLLHRGVFGCVEKIAQGIKTDACIKYVEKYLKVLRYYNCKIFLVFDGKPLPAKQEVNNERKKKRDSNLKQGNELMAVGLKEEAYKVLRQGIGVPKYIQEDAIRYFNNQPDVTVIVAPYEADAQLAFLIQNDVVDVVATEDSDLVVFGCDKILFKLAENGSCTIFENEKLSRCVCPVLAKNFDFEVFRRICIMSGCDYFPSGLAGVGLKKAETLFTKTSIKDLRKLLPKVPLYLNNRSLKITPKLIDDFVNAETVFNYQIVYDTRYKCNRPLVLYENTLIGDYVNYSEKVLIKSREFPFAGQVLEPSEADMESKGGEEGQKPPSQLISLSQSTQPSNSPSPPSSSSLSPPPIKQSPLFKSPTLSSSVINPLKRSGRLGLTRPAPKRKVVFDDSNPIVVNVLPQSNKLSFDTSKLNTKKIFNPSCKVSYTKVTITNVAVNRPFVSPLLRDISQLGPPNPDRSESAHLKKLDSQNVN